MSTCKSIKDIIYSAPLKRDSIVQFIFDDNTALSGRVASSDTYFISILDSNNSEVFCRLGIKDKNAFVSNIVGYSVKQGTSLLGWPEVNSLRDLEKVLNALKTINKKMTNNISLKIKKKVKSLKLNFNL